MHGRKQQPEEKKKKREIVARTGGTIVDRQGSCRCRLEIQLKDIGHYIRKQKMEEVRQVVAHREAGRQKKRRT